VEEPVVYHDEGEKRGTYRLVSGAIRRVARAHRDHL